MKREIYTPLYEKLKKQERDLKQFPFPPSGSSFVNQLYYDWVQNEMKSIFLELPKKFNKQMEKLLLKIEEYKQIREKTHISATAILNGELAANNLPRCENENVGYYLSQDILNRIDKNSYRKFIPKDTDEEIINKINLNVWEKASADSSFVQTQEKYENFLSVQKETIEMLERMVRKIQG